MSILIKGMKMPTGERPVHIEIHRDGTVLQWKFNESDEIIGTAVEVPPHGRLGDLDRLEQMFADIDNAPYSGFDGTEPFYSAEDAAQIIRLAPTIIPAEEVSGNSGELED